MGAAYQGGLWEEEIFEQRPEQRNMAVKEPATWKAGEKTFLVERTTSAKALGYEQTCRVLSPAQLAQVACSYTASLETFLTTLPPSSPYGKDTICCLSSFLALIAPPSNYGIILLVAGLCLVTLALNLPSR